MTILALICLAVASWPGGIGISARIHGATDTGAVHRIRAREPPPWARSLLQKFAAGSSVDPHELAGDLELYVACVQAGLNPAAAVTAVAESATASTARAWEQTATMLHMGISAQQAWAPIANVQGLEGISAIGQTSSNSGASMESGLKGIAQQLQQGAEAHAVASAERAGVFIAMPLTVCFLPAFFVLGLLPVLYQLGSSMF
ncbi:type II secretion system F family protein [Corynebacterium gerontici]|uniref:Type II secretion system protein GspF domain-containing protein n=1 Tax=Corynebacterium gerontici TaxID=2079234 RepID=A0A3G6J5S0_9CORY|nr:type II secretion system F family protein [Corynebacterium gerontici]AZA12278.1 hypothetical protein CGERO_09960 [Corynebacterium gerontici]